MIAIVDYGVGNLFSLVSSLRSIGFDAVVTSDKYTLRRAEKLILPGVGAFGDAAKKLKDSGLDRVIIDEARKGKALMGICLGMQLLFERSYEYGSHEGLGLLQGEIVSMESTLKEGLKIPHIGWNALHITKPCYLFKYLKGKDCVYFVHSYHGVGCGDSLVATTEYGIELTAAVCRENISGCQFHPEKSGSVGLSILRAFCEGESV